MVRQVYLDKVTQRSRNLNIARLYFEEDKSLVEIKKDYPELSKARIWKIAFDYRDIYKEAKI